MVEEPRTVIKASSAERFDVSGNEPTTCQQSAERWFNAFDVAARLQIDSINELPVHIAGLQLPPRHSGLGSGTQIALATASALNHFFQFPTPSIDELSVAVGRAKRSAIGSHGFVEGGFLVDQGKNADEAIASLDFQTDFPQDWPVVLMFPDQPSGLAGKQEQAAFEQISATTLEQYSTMRSIVRQQIVPALVQSDYQQFADALFEFGHRSGLYFEAVQGGAYHGPTVNDLIKHVRQVGVPAVGQTSWGPCVFAIAKDSDLAAALAASVEQHFGDQCSVQITRADNSGALLNDHPNLLGRPRVSHRLET